MLGFACFRSFSVVLPLHLIFMWPNTWCLSFTFSPSGAQASYTTQRRRASSSTTETTTGRRSVHIFDSFSTLKCPLLSLHHLHSLQYKSPHAFFLKYAVPPPPSPLLLSPKVQSFGLHLKENVYYGGYDKNKDLPCTCHTYKGGVLNADAFAQSEYVGRETKFIEYGIGNR